LSSLAGDSRHGFQSLREYLGFLEERQWLTRVAAPVSPELEITEVATRVVKEQGPAALETWSAHAKASRWGVLKRNSSPLLDLDKILAMEDEYLPKELKRDYKGTFGHKTHF